MDCVLVVRHMQRAVLITIWNTKKTRHLIDQYAHPHPCDENQNNDSDQKIDRTCDEAVSCSDGLNHWRESEDEQDWQDPHKTKKWKRKTFVEISPVDQFHDDEWQYKGGADDH